MKKFIAISISILFALTMCVTAMAQETSETSLEEVISNGTLIDSSTVETEKGVFAKETYEYTEKVSTTRNVEQEYIKTVVSVITPLSSQRAYEPGIGRGSVWLKAHYVTRPSATAEEYSDLTGYRLTKVTGYIEENGVIEQNLVYDTVTTYCLDPKNKADDTIQTFDLTGEEINFIRTPNYSSYVADVPEAKLGASLVYWLYGEEETVNAFLFGDPI